MKDIKIIHELDETLNQRVIFIKNNIEKYPIIDIVTSSNKSESYYHAVYFTEYLNNYYLQDRVLQDIKQKLTLWNL